MACTFCGSGSIVVKNPFIELKDTGKYEPTTSFCCRAQKQNALYAKKHFREGEAPPPEEIAKG